MGKLVISATKFGTASVIKFLLEKLMVSHRVSNISNFYAVRRSITLFARARQWFSYSELNESSSHLVKIRFNFFNRSTASELGLREIGCEDGRWMELAQDRVQWRAFVLAVLNLRVLMPES
jgi:hypothetical protein